MPVILTGARIWNFMLTDYLQSLAHSFQATCYLYHPKAPSRSES